MALRWLLGFKKWKEEYQQSYQIEFLVHLIKYILN